MQIDRALLVRRAPWVGGAALGAVGGLALSSVCVRASRKNPENQIGALLVGGLPTTAVFATAAASQAKLGARGKAAYGAFLGLGIASAAATLIVAPDAFNTVDTGLSALEQPAFHDRWVQRRRTDTIVGTAFGLLAGTSIALFNGPTASSLRIGAVAGSALGATGGLFVGAFNHTNGQEVPYAPRLDTVEGVTTALWNGARTGPSATSIDVLSTAGPRQTRSPGIARFYVDADRDGDHKVTRDELAARVRGFDDDHDGRVTWSSGEWARLHAAVVS